MKTILITGAAGELAGYLRREHAGRYLLRLSDMQPISALAEGESFVPADLASMEDMLAQLVLKSKLADAREVWDQASAMSWVGPDAPPFFVIHGQNDSLVPVEQARSFVAMLRAESKSPVAYAELPGAQHAFEIFDSPRTLFTAGAVHRFLEAIRVREGQVANTPSEAPRDGSAVGSGS